MDLISDILFTIIGGLGIGFLFSKLRNALPKDKQISFVKNIIYSLVIQAEKELGSKTGQAKFALVVGKFLSICPKDLRVFVTDESLTAWIEEAVTRLKEYLQTVPEGADNILKK